MSEGGGKSLRKRGREGTGKKNREKEVIWRESKRKGSLEALVSTERCWLGHGPLSVVLTRPLDAVLSSCL